MNTRLLILVLLYALVLWLNQPQTTFTHVHSPQAAQGGGFTHLGFPKKPMVLE